MAPTGDDDHYHPKDALHAGFRGALATGGIGLLFAAVRNSLAVRNVGPWTTITRHGGMAATFGISLCRRRHAVHRRPALTCRI